MGYLSYLFILWKIIPSIKYCRIPNNNLRQKCVIQGRSPMEKPGRCGQCFRSFTWWGIQTMLGDYFKAWVKKWNHVKWWMYVGNMYYFFMIFCPIDLLFFLELWYLWVWRIPRRSSTGWARQQCLIPRQEEGCCLANDLGNICHLSSFIGDRAYHFVYLRWPSQIFRNNHK